MLDNPICQCAFKSDVPSRLFGFNPLVFQDFLAFCLKFPVKRRVLQQVVRRQWHFRFVRHNRDTKIILRRHIYIKVLKLLTILFWTQEAMLSVICSTPRACAWIKIFMSGLAPMILQSV
jgi:hypothetical protein